MSRCNTDEGFLQTTLEAINVMVFKSFCNIVGEKKSYLSSIYLSLSFALVNLV